MWSVLRRSKSGGNAAAAEQLLSDAAKIEAGLESVPADQVADLRRLAAARGDTGAFDRATRLLAAALKAEQTSGSGSPLVIAEIAETSARFAARRGQEKRARDLWEETADIVQAARGGGHPAAVAAAISRERLARAPAPAIASAPTAAKPATGARRLRLRPRPGLRTSWQSVPRPAARRHNGRPRRGRSRRPPM